MPTRSPLRPLPPVHMPDALPALIDLLHTAGAKLGDGYEVSLRITQGNRIVELSMLRRDGGSRDDADDRKPIRQIRINDIVTTDSGRSYRVLGGDTTELRAVLVRQDGRKWKGAKPTILDLDNVDIVEITEDDFERGAVVAEVDVDDVPDEEEGEEEDDEDE